MKYKVEFIHCLGSSDSRDYIENFSTKRAALAAAKRFTRANGHGRKAVYCSASCWPSDDEGTWISVGGYDSSGDGYISAAAVVSVRAKF